MRTLSIAVSRSKEEKNLTSKSDGVGDWKNFTDTYELGKIIGRFCLFHQQFDLLKVQDCTLDVALKYTFG